MPADTPDWMNGLGIYTPIVPQINLPPGAGTGPIDVSAYGSFVISYPLGVTSTDGADIQVTDPDNITPNFFYEITSPVDGLGNAPLVSAFNTMGNRVSIRNNSGTQSVTIAVFGSSNRLAKNFVSVSQLDLQTLSTVKTWAAGTTQLGSSYVGGVGRAMAHFEVGGNVVKGFFQIATANGTFNVCDTSETSLNPDNTQRINKEIILPRVLSKFQFLCRVGGLSTISVGLIFEGD